MFSSFLGIEDVKPKWEAETSAEGWIIPIDVNMPELPERIKSHGNEPGLPMFSSTSSGMLLY